MEKVKVVYIDGSKEIVLKGDLISNDEFTVTIKNNEYPKPIIIGKRTLIKLTYINEEI